ncbi:hypothetical protein X777_13207 [Ooceraea biroi]|uniref:Uncharacterized protein n=1 Tax=Ooceraea biroi TaxID=2015173 RepID=A0A026VY22_OOCBI|nr:hypothetical protein X777_13207 [Ooceraea biroi]
MTILCLCGKLPIQLLKSMTSCRLPHFVKSPAWMKTSPAGMSNFMKGVRECVSLIHTTRNWKLKGHLWKLFDLQRAEVHAFVWTQRKRSRNRY